MSPPAHETTEILLEEAERVCTEERAYLLVSVEGAESVFALRPNSEVIVGRSETADLVLKYPWISRAHAKLVTSVNGTVISDLNSHNGTRINGERISSARALVSGDVIALGAVTLSFCREKRLFSQHQTVDIEQFKRRLDEELERGLRRDHPFCILVIDVSSTNVDVSESARTVSKRLRLPDVVARTSGKELLILLPETRADELPQIVRRVLGDFQAPVRVGSAVFPTDGFAPLTLVELARSRAKTFSPEDPLPASDLASTIPLGSQTVVVADPAMRRIFTLLERLAQNDIPVLIGGETGVGKEIAASALHAWSRRSSQRMTTINCAALQETLIESELFGCEKGALSGADGTKAGLFESAHGGTVFLDEIGDLSPAAQARLLRILETKRVGRVGSLLEKDIDVRIVSATNHDLEDDIASGRFREDLFFRLSAATVILPPLRSRLQALPILAERFLEDACTRMGRSSLVITPEAMQRLSAYPWPGNIRELKNTMEYVVTVTPEPVTAIAVKHLPERVSSPAASRPRRGVELTAAEGIPVTSLREPLEDSRKVRPSPTFRSLYDEVRELERTRIAEALAAAGGVQKRAAELIGVPLRTFTDKIREHDLATQTLRLRRSTRDTRDKEKDKAE